jgi:hypothetical protein
MIVFRAMSEKEFLLTLEYERPIFIKKFKWFSEDKNFIINRVCDGKFNNSSFCKNRYTHIVKFIADGKRFIKLNNKELMINRNINFFIKPIDYEIIKK